MKATFTFEVPDDADEEVVTVVLRDALSEFISPRLLASAYVAKKQAGLPDYLRSSPSQVNTKIASTVKRVDVAISIRQTGVYQQLF